MRSTGESELTRKLLDRLAEVLGAMREFLVAGRLARRREPVEDRPSLRRFLETRASFVAQTSLYGYLRTRAGMRFPQLFDDDPFVASINIAKWHVWLACLSDLAVYAGGLLEQRAPGRTAEIARLVRELVEEILAATGRPADADEEFLAHADRLRTRLSGVDWAAIGDDESAFVESPPALVRWAPIIDELKRLDESIVENSVRFRWQEVRRDLRRNLDAEAVLGAALAAEPS